MCPGNTLYIDEQKKLWSINPKKNLMYKFSEITGYELIEIFQTSSSGGIGRALLGGLLFGGIGAIVGGSTGSKVLKNIVTEMKIKVNLDSFTNPVVYVKILSFVRYKSDSFMCKEAKKDADKLLAIFELMTKNK